MRVNESQKQRLIDVFEPIVEWNEGIIDIYIFREPPTCIHYLLFRLLAPFWTRRYCLALTDKRVVMLPIPRLGYSEYLNHLSVNYDNISADDNNGIKIELANPRRILILKFELFEKQNNKDTFKLSLENCKNKTQVY